MATVTVFSALRMLAIEAASIVSGVVNGGGDLILTKHDGSTINAGKVKGDNGPVASMGTSFPAIPVVGQIFYDTSNLVGLTDLMAAKNPVTATTNWVAYGSGYNTGETFAIAGGGCTITWSNTSSHFAGIPLTGLVKGQPYLIKARLVIPAGSPDAQVTIGYRASGQPITVKGVEVTTLLAGIADSDTLSFGIETLGGATGTVIVKELKVYAVSTKGFPEYFWDGTSWVQTESMAQKAVTFSSVNTFGDQSIAGVKTLTDRLVVAPSTDILPLTIKRGADPGGVAARLLDMQDHAGASLASFDYNGGLSAYTVSSLYGLFTALDADRLRMNRTNDISSTDLNSLAYSGLFSGTSLTHSPDGTTANFIIESIIIDANTALQRGIPAGTTNPQIYVRAKSGGTWGAWTNQNQVVTAWTAVTYENGWSDLSGYQPAQYRKVGDTVQLRGVPKGGTISATLPMFTLPAGFRPPVQLVLPCVTQRVAFNTGAATAGTAHTHPIASLVDIGGRINVTAAGVVATSVIETNVYVSIDGVSFSTL